MKILLVGGTNDGVRIELLDKELERRDPYPYLMMTVRKPSDFSYKAIYDLPRVSTFATEEYRLIKVKTTTGFEWLYEFTRGTDAMKELIAKYPPAKEVW